MDPLEHLRTQESIDKLLEDLNDICQEWDGYVYGLPLLEEPLPPDDVKQPLRRLRQAVLNWLGGEYGQ